MAICRCLKNHAWPKGRTAPFVAYVMSVGYPNTACICKHCDEPGVIWLTTAERSTYQMGQRIFDGPGNFVRMQADGQGVKEK
jgi:hypothetical protein